MMMSLMFATGIIFGILFQSAIDDIAFIKCQKQRDKLSNKMMEIIIKHKGADNDTKR